MPKVGRPRKRQELNYKDARAKIETTKLIKRLSDHVYGAAKLEPSQVTAALGLLKKAIPDLAAVQMEHSGQISVVGDILNQIDGTSGVLDGYGSPDRTTEKPTLQ